MFSEQVCLSSNDQNNLNHTIYNIYDTLTGFYIKCWFWGSSRLLWLKIGCPRLILMHTANLYFSIISVFFSAMYPKYISKTKMKIRKLSMEGMGADSCKTLNRVGGLQSSQADHILPQINCTWLSYLLALIKPKCFTILLLYGCHNNIDIIIAKAKDTSVWVYKIVRRKSANTGKCTSASEFKILHSSSSNSWIKSSVPYPRGETTELTFNSIHIYCNTG